MFAGYPWGMLGAAKDRPARTYRGADWVEWVIVLVACAVAIVGITWLTGSLGIGLLVGLVLGGASAAVIAIL